GPKNFTSLVPHYLSVEDMMGSDTLDTHNVWIGTLAEQGVIGFVTYVILCIAILRLATRVLRRGPSSMVRSLCLAFLAYHVFWFTMSQHYFSKGTGHIHFMIVGFMLGLSRSTDTLEPLKLRSETNYMHLLSVIRRDIFSKLTGEIFSLA